MTSASIWELVQPGVVTKTMSSGFPFLCVHHKNVGSILTIPGISANISFPPVIGTTTFNLRTPISSLLTITQGRVLPILSPTVGGLKSALRANLIAVNRTEMILYGRTDSHDDIICQSCKKVKQNKYDRPQRFCDIQECKCQIRYRLAMGFLGHNSATTNLLTQN